MPGSKILIGFVILAIPIALAPALLAPGAAVLTGRPRASLDGTTLAEGAPRFALIASWPKPLPGDRSLGQVTDLAVDSRDHLWIVHRRRSASPNGSGENADGTSPCCAAPVLELDPAGNVVRSWGGPAISDAWPESPHTIHVDAHGNVWIAGNGRDDDHVLKFAPDGRLLLQIGTRGESRGSNDTLTLGQPAAIDTDSAANEVYIADGYRNRRIIVFDATTGRYKRHWGAYGGRPSDASPPAYDPAQPPPGQFGTPVHGVLVSRDRFVYVADRANDRIQVFRTDGEFVTEAAIAPQTRGLGSVWDLAFSHDSAQRYLYVADGSNRKVWIVARDGLRVVGELGRGRRGSARFGWVHALAVDSRGSLHTADVDVNDRVQKFAYSDPPPLR